MKTRNFTRTCFVFVFLCAGFFQSAYSQTLFVSYDKAGNRVLVNTLKPNPKSQTPAQTAAKKKGTSSFKGFANSIASYFNSVTDNVEEVLQNFVPATSSATPAVAKTNKEFKKDEPPTRASVVVCIVFPNPAVDQITLSDKNGFTQALFEVTVYNAIGQVSDHFLNTALPFSIDVSRYQSGSYYMSITQKDVHQTIKFIKL